MHLNDYVLFMLAGVMHYNEVYASIISLCFIIIICSHLEVLTLPLITWQPEHGIENMGQYIHLSKQQKICASKSWFYQICYSHSLE